MADSAEPPAACADDLPHVLVAAYAFSPVLGSEFAQGWNYVSRMKDRYRLTVLVGSADGRMGDMVNLDHPAVAALGSTVRIVPVPMDGFCRAIKVLDVRYRMSWLFVLGLRRWHWLAYQRAVALLRDDPFDAIHQLGPVGFRNPGYLHRLGIPSYWGPIGGFQYVRLALAFRSSPRYALTSLVRNASTFLAARSRYVRSAVRGFDRLSFATRTNRDNFAALFKVNGPVLSDQATVHGWEDGYGAAKLKPGRLNVIWCGTVDARKNIKLLIDIATRAEAMDVPCSFTVVGTGPMLDAARSMTVERGLRHVHFTGQLPREQVQAAFHDAHVLCFTSLSEANTSTLFEALDAGCIPLSLDLDGFSTNITADIGFVISPDQEWNAIVAGYVDRLAELAGDTALRTGLAQTIAAHGQRYSWQVLADRHAAIIDALMPARRQ